jgi:hypothetical protein
MLRGKGMFTWVIKDCEGGDIDKIIERSKEAQLTFLMPKIADANYEYVHNSPYLAEFVEKCHNADIKVIPWQFVYGNYPQSEANRAIIELRKYPYDGFVINAEGAYKNRPIQAEEYCKILRGAFPNLFLGLSSFRFPIKYHADFPWNAFLKYVDVNMPQVYWEKADGQAVKQLEQCLSEFYDSRFIQRPIMPTGSAYTNDGWVAKAPDIVNFINAMDNNQLVACSFWEWRYPRHRFPELWDAIVNTPFPGESTPPVQPTGKYRIVMIGNLTVRDAPEGNPTGDYALAGNTYTGYEVKDGWYRIGEGEWISGKTKWTGIEEIMAPEPPPLTIEERVEVLEKEVERLKKFHE